MLLPKLRITISEQNDTGAVKTWLWRYRYAKLEVRRLEGEYRELVETQESTGAIKYDGMPATGNITDLSDIIVQRDRSLTKLNRAISNMCAVRDEITTAIDKLQYEKEKAVLSYRYIQLRGQFEIRSFQEIASILGYSESRVKTLHALGLQNLSPIIKVSTRQY